MKYLLQLLFTILPLFLCSQNILEYSTKENKLTSGKDIKAGEKYQIKITGVNSSKINLDLDTKYSQYEVKVPDILKPILGTTLENYSPPSVGASIYQIPLFEIQERLKLLTRLSNSIYKLDDTDMSKFKSMAKDSLNYLINQYASVDDFKKSKISTLKFDYNKDVEKNIKDPLLLADKENIEKVKKAIQKDIRILALIHQHAFAKIGRKNEELDDRYILSIYELEQLINQKYLEKYSFLNNAIIAKDHILSKKFGTKKDVVSVEAKIYNSISKDTTLTTKFDLYTKHKWVFGFSFGGFYNQIGEQSYFIENNPDTLETFNYLRSENSNLNDVSFGALSHLSYKIKSNFAVGINLGAALSPFDAKTRYLYGVSTIIGRKSQVALNFGVASAKINTLSAQVTEMGDNLTIPRTVTTVPVFSDWNHSFYFGISYNIFKTK